MGSGIQKKILLVEDDAIIALDEQVVLTQYGYDVLVVHSGNAAISIFTSTAGIDLILMDIDLGSGLSGTDTAKEILKIKDIPIVFLSSHVESEIVKTTEKITSYGYVVKNSGITILDASIKMAFKLFDANRRILESEEKQNAMISGISDVIGIVDEQCIIKYSSPNSWKWFGWTTDELIGTNGMSMVHPDDCVRIQEVFSSLTVNPDRSSTIEYRHRCKDGSYKYIELTGTNLFHDPCINGILVNYHDITDRKSIEEALRLSESRLTRAETVAGIGNWALSPDSKKMFCSSGANAIYGMEGNNASLSSVQKIPLLEYRDRLDIALHDLISEGKPYNLEFQIQRADNHEIRDIHSIADYDKKTNTVVGVILDITDRKKIERTLKESEYFFKESQRAAFVGSYKIDFSTGTWISSEIMDEIFGIDKDYKRGIEDWFNLIHPDDRKMLADEIISNRNQYSKKYRIIHKKSGELRWVHALGQASFNDEGKIIQLIGTIQDITDSKRIEFELKAKNEELEALNEEMQATLEEMEATNEELIATGEELRIKEKALIHEKDFIEALLESLPGYLYVYDSQSKLIRWNKKHEVMTGYSAEELSHMTLSDWFDAEDSIMVAAAVENIFKTGYGEVEAQLKIKGGKKIWIRSNGVPLTIDGETYFTGVGIDITEQKRNHDEHEKLMEQLHLTQRMDAIGQLAGGVAHDFNNMLTGIMGAAELLSDDTITPQQKKSYIDIIMAATGRAADLTGKLLAFSRKGNKLSTALDVTKIITDTIAILKRTLDKQIRIVYENEALYTTVVGDDAMLQNVFMNLGINASHAMSNGGVLSFIIKNSFLDLAYCKTCPYEIEPGEFIDVEIRDTGCGIPVEIQNHIFEPFFTTKEQGKGTGLGLSVAFGTIQDHHGIIHVNSEVGKGTSFHIYLPLSKDAKVELVKEEPVVKGSGTILLIDDEELILITAKRILESMGYKVLTAGNGSEGLHIFNELKDEINLVILDMIMPVMSGRETFTRIRTIDSKAKVILASGFSREENLVEMKKNGLNGFIRKPFRQAELSKIISEILAAE